jgi:hypothetical protein
MIDAARPALVARIKTDKPNDWYDSQLESMFGKLSCTRLREGRSEERGLLRPWTEQWTTVHCSVRRDLVIWLAATAGCTVYGARLCSTLTDYPSVGLACLRLSNMALYYLLLVPLFYLFLTSMIWMFKLAAMPLKPDLSRSPAGGLRALSSIVSLNLGIYLVVHVTGWSWSLLMSGKTDPVSDTVNMSLCGLGALIWAVVVPVALRRAMRTANQDAVLAYSSKMDKAYGKFLDKPDAGTLEDLEWLTFHEYVVDRPSTSLLSRTQRFWFLFGGPAVVVLFWLFYVVSYGKYLQGVRTWLCHMLG